MGAKTPTKQNNNINNNNGILSGVVKNAQIKKVTAKDAESSLITSKDNDGKKQTPTTSVATSNSKKTSKLVANNVKAVKKSQIVVDSKKNKKQAMGSNSNKVNNSKSNHAAATETIEVKSNLNHDESNKAEKLSSTNSSMSSQTDSAKRKINEKESDKSKSTVASAVGGGVKKLNNKNDESSGKKTNADKQKSPSKVVRKNSKERDNKIKISNELKNLGIEMSKSTNSTIDSIQENLSSGMKTSICEMVKLKKARHHQNSNIAAKTKGSSANQSTIDNSIAAADNKTLSKISKESPQGERIVVKKTEPKSKTTDNCSTQVQSEQQDDDKSQKVTKKPINNTQTKSSETSMKRKYVKKNKEATEPQKDTEALITLTTSDNENKPKEKKVVVKKSNENIKLSSPKKLKSNVQSVGKVNSTNTSNKEALEKQKYTKNQTDGSICNQSKVESVNKGAEVITQCLNTNVIENINKESTDAKQKDTANSSNSNKSKEKSTLGVKNNDSKKAPPKKVANETKAQANNKKSGSVKDAKKTAATKKDKSATSKRNNNAEEKDPLKLSSSESESASADSDSDVEISDDIFKKPAKPQKSLHNKNVKQIRVIKKSRVASLNAIAKVHCLYENEARTHLDSSISKAIKKPVNIVVCNVSSDEEDDDEESSDDKETENVSKRSLRTAPHIRAIGKHWEMDSLSSDIDSDSDVSQRPAKYDAKTKSITKSNSTKNQDTKSLAKQHDTKSSSKMKNQIKKTFKQPSKQIKASDDSQRDSDKETDRKLSSSSAVRKKQQQKNSVVSKKTSLASAVSKKKSNGSIKRKKTKDDDKNCDKNVITKKRMASLNASAILAANYEIENYAAKHESSTTETSDSSENDDDDEKKDKKSKIEPPTMKKEKKDVKMESAEEARPKSTTNLVKIDTDVTITGVYVNSALVSSQETICKTLKYRTAYSVTEECVVSRPPTQEPPKSYTPLSALTNMRPPMGQQLQDPCMTSSSEQYQPQMPHQPQPQMYYQYPPSHTHPMPSTSSAFYPPQPVHHRDPMSYYQPAGPSFTPHLLPPPPSSLEGDQIQTNQPTSGATGENDPDVMITGGDIAPRPQPYRYGPHPPPPPDFSRPLHPQQMHYPPTYPPYYYGQPPPPPISTDLCYPYYPPKYYPNSPYTSRRPPYMAPSYYQPPPLDYRSQQPQPVPQNAPQQIVPAAPTPQHIDPHYSNAPYYPSAYNTGQCYSQTPPRNLQPPAYLDAHQYHSASCPCPMQSCQSKNVHTGTGPTNKAKGPVSASSNGMAESSSSAPTIMSCKIENNILSPSVLIKPENDKINGTSSSSIENQNQIGMVAGGLKVHELYSNIPSSVKVLDTPELSLSPARGSTGIQQVQHEAAVQPTENNLNSDNVSISLRKQARIGKSMERDRQQQNHTSHHGYHNHLLHHNNNNNNHATMIECGSRALEMTTQFKQEFPVKKERESDVKVEKVCDDDDMDIEMDFRSSSIKVEQPELPIELTTQKLPENDLATVNLTTESCDECGIDYTIKRKHDDSDADVIELSDNNSTQDMPLVTPPVKRRKLLETPINTPKKSSPNSYKNLIKPNAFATPTSESTTTVVTTPTVAVTKPKLITSNINKIKPSIKRKSLLKSKSTSFKTIGFAIKAKRRALLKRKKQQQQQQKKALEVDEKSQQQNTKTIEKLSSDNDELIENATKQSELIEDENDNSSSETCERVSTEISEHNEEKSMDGSSEYSGKSNIDLTIDRVAKGYFSESDVFSSLSKHRKTKSQKRFEAKLLDLCAKKKKKMQNGKDKDLTVPSEKEKSKKKTKNSKVNKEKETKEGTSMSAAANSTLDTEMSKNKKEKEKTSTSSKKTKKTKTKEPKENLELIKEKKKTKTSATKKKNSKNVENEKDLLQSDELLPTTHSTPKRKQNSNKKASTNTTVAPIITTTTTTTVNDKIESSAVDSEEDDKTIVTKDEDTSTSLISTATTTTVKTTKPHLDETDVANNNNECFEDNNNRQKQQEPLTLYKTAAYGWTTAINKANGKRGRKGKKLKLTLPNDIVIPKSTSIPRWSNGWVFEGEPYQALVFLNSDDPPVPRTCYDSMRHEECGDVIRPRDCVLLRAGGKRNELPYVAKVAQLFENPEDGEMMMSLFWYYRPEHTEQGRQCNDAIDEVFASRHKDHNSVACIEDKCYVITYNEYCRYRKSLKAVEENIEEPPSVVPKLQLSERRLVPPNTSPELVMFCRRVYDFRAKRLMDDKKKK